MGKEAKTVKQRVCNNCKAEFSMTAKEIKLHEIQCRLIEKLTK